MTLTSLLTSLRLQSLISWRRPMLFYAAVWTSLLTLTVAVAALSPELAFLWAISPSSSFSTACGAKGGSSSFIRVPAELPSELMCLPVKGFRHSKADLVVPPIFAALVVAASACVVRAVGL